MSACLEVGVEGIGFWAPGMPDWDAAQRVLLGDEPDPHAPQKPRAEILAPNERRRAPPGVLLALEVAAQAVAASGRDAARVPAVFASTHGELGITDYMCETLAHAPGELSPTRFHNSVHNAAVGYWTIATGCHAASSAVSAHQYTLGAGLLQAAVQARADAEPVLFVAYDVCAAGPLLKITGATQPLALSLMLAPLADTGTRPVARLRLSLASGPAATSTAAPEPAALAAATPLAPALILAGALARDASREVRLAAAPQLQLNIKVDA